MKAIVPLYVTMPADVFGASGNHIRNKYIYIYIVRERVFARDQRRLQNHRWFYNYLCRLLGIKPLRQS